jgi:predicted deacylase
VQHGDEYSGMEISNRVFDDINPKEFRGCLISIPVSNPLAFNVAERASPPPMGYENLNMNRVWPGDSKGLLMERIAAQIWDQVIINSDLVVDLHEGGRAFMARYIHARGISETEKLVGEQNKRLYQLFGQGVPVLGGVNTRPSMMGSLSIQAGLNGIPTLSPELGGGGRLWEDLVNTGIQGVKNVMIGLGMLNEEPVDSNSEQLVSDGSSWPKTQHGGARAIQYHSSVGCLAGFLGFFGILPSRNSPDDSRGESRPERDTGNSKKIARAAIGSVDEALVPSEHILLPVIAPAPEAQGPTLNLIVRADVIVRTQP